SGCVDDWRGTGFCPTSGYAASRAGLDAALWSGVVFSSCKGTRASLETVSDRKHVLCIPGGQRIVEELFQAVERGGRLEPAVRRTTRRQWPSRAWLRHDFLSRRYVCFMRAVRGWAASAFS